MITLVTNVATGANSLHVAWWSGDASVVAKYSILCSTLHTASNKTAIDQHRVTQFTDEAINSLNVDNLVPLTTYNCCIAEYGMDNSRREVCKTATTSPADDCQQGSTQNLSPIVGAAILSLLVMLLITLLCTSILCMVVVKQKKDGKKIRTIW